MLGTVKFWFQLHVQNLHLDASTVKFYLLDIDVMVNQTVLTVLTKMAVVRYV